MMNGFKWQIIAMSVAALGTVGCATTKSSDTARTASEQLLISAAIDKSLSNVRFNDFAGYKVFIDEKYLDSVDKGYLVGTLRHKVLNGGGSLVAAADAADLVLEPRSGGVGTDSQESFIGIPAIGIPGLPIELPEIKVASKQTQMGTAKIGLVCYDPKTGQSLGTGGDTTALTHNSDTYIAGVGPFRSGAVVEARQKSVGFTGIGGSLMGNKVARASSPVDVIGDRNATAQLPVEVPASAGAPGFPGPTTATEKIAQFPEYLNQ